MKLDIPHTSLRTNGEKLEIPERNPCMLSLSKYSESFYQPNSYFNVALILRAMLKSKACSGSTGCAGLIRSDASAIICF